MPVLDRPRLRGWIHAVAAPAFLAAGVVLTCRAPTVAAAAATGVFAATATWLFGASAAYALSAVFNVAWPTRRGGYTSRCT
jgi:hemolysin III